MGVTIRGGVLLKKWKEHSFVSDNACEANSRRKLVLLNLDESDFNSKKENGYIKYVYEKCCAIVLGNAFNYTYVVYLLLAHKCRTSLGV